ncbi:MAG: ABC transporter ATP-binding protein [Bacteroidota bacterium]
MLIWAAQTSAAPYVLKYIIDQLTSFQGSFHETLSHLQYPLLLYAFLWMVYAISMRLWNYLDIRLFVQIRREVAMQMVTHVSGQSHEYFQDNFAGSLLNKINDLVDGTALVLEKILDGFGHLMMLTIAIVTLTLAHPFFGLILLSWSIVSLFIAWYFSGRIQKRAVAFSKERTFYVGHIVDMLSNSINMRLFAQRAYEIDRIDTTVKRTAERDRELRWEQLKLKAIWDGSIVIMVWSMLLTLLFMYSEGKISIGDFSFVIMLSVSAFHFVRRFLREAMSLSGEVGKCKQALTLLNTPYAIEDSPNALPLKLKQGAIDFKEVTFAYPNKKENPIFNEQNVEIAPSEKVGLVGFSGAGKTTFVNLLLRLFDIQKGRITIDGQDIREVTRDSLRNHIAMIPQDTTLFHRTVMENIRYGNPKATDKEVIEASKKAFCHDFIDLLPEKYDTLVGERGLKLSGGQRQRIAVARAILKDAPILILDEATSSLDSVTEHAIQESLSELMKGRTTIVIAHRLSTLALMDRILVLEQGKVIEEGTHTQLIAKKGTYERMWQMQAGGFMPLEDA